MASVCSVTFVPRPPRYVPRLYWVVFMSPCVVLYVDGSALEAKWSRPTRFDVEPGMHDLLITHTAGFWRMKPLELSLEVSGPTEVFYRAPFVLFQRGKVVVRPSLEPSA